MGKILSIGDKFPEYKKTAVVSIEAGKEFAEITSEDHKDENKWMVMFWYPKDFTFALCSVVLAVATSEKMEGNYIYGLAIGLTVTASAFSVGGITGGAFNPAVYLGPMLMDTFTGGSSISHIILYLVGPLAGGALAAIIYKILNSD